MNVNQLLNTGIPNVYLQILMWRGIIEGQCCGTVPGQEYNTHREAKSDSGFLQLFWISSFHCLATISLPSQQPSPRRSPYPFHQ